LRQAKRDDQVSISSSGLNSRFYQGNLDEAMFFYTESLKTNPTVSEYLLSVKEIAVIKSIEGFNKSDLNDLETLLPLLKYAEPFAYFDVLNSYAVELSETSRLKEAEQVSRLIILSPFSPYYSEWQETHLEVNQKLYKSRSTITVNLPAKKTRKRQRPVDKTKAKVIAFPRAKDSFLRPSYGPPTEEET
jgi:hypothetical protein